MAFVNRVRSCSLESKTSKLRMAQPFVSQRRRSPKVMFSIKRVTLVFCLMSTLAVVAAAQAPPAAMNSSMATTGAQEKKSLYARLGGYDAIAAVVDDFVG